MLPTSGGMDPSSLFSPSDRCVKDCHAVAASEALKCALKSGTEGKTIALLVLSAQKLPEASRFLRE